MSEQSNIILSTTELFALTGYEQSTKQLNVLHERGFHRAYIGRHGLILERAHYEAVAGGKNDAPSPRKEPNLAWMTGKGPRPY